MKTIFFFVFLLLLTNISKAQSYKIKRFEIEASAVFWTPYSSHLKATSEHFQFNLNNGASSSDGSFSGYGSTIAPALAINYYFKNYLGVSLGVKYMYLYNDMNTASEEVRNDNIKNKAYIYHLTAGISGKLLDSNIVGIYYGIGMDIIPYYYMVEGYKPFFEFASFHSKPSSTLGFYVKAGYRLRIYKGILLTTGIEYSNIPVNIDYFNNHNNLYSHTTAANLGGISLNIGLSVNF